MNHEQTISYNIIVGELLNNSKLIKSNINIDSLNERERMWYNLCPAIYVIGEPTTLLYFIEDSEKQGFSSLVNFLYPKMINELFETHPKECEILVEWFLKENGYGEPCGMELYDFYVLGCHISHVIVSMDIIKNNYKRALVFENDSKFYDYVSDEFLKTLTQIYNEDLDEQFGFLNLGYPAYKDRQPTYELEGIKIFNHQTQTTHSYIINKKTSEKLVESINTDNECPKDIYRPNTRETSYRCGADDFFYGFIENFSLYLPYTYQQFIGNNREQSYL
jgi:hypothetical protein